MKTATGSDRYRAIPALIEGAANAAASKLGMLPIITSTASNNKTGNVLPLPQSLSLPS